MLLIVNLFKDVLVDSHPRVVLDDLVDNHPRVDPDVLVDNHPNLITNSILEEVMKKSFISTDSDIKISPENNISLEVLDSIHNIYKNFTSDIIPEEQKKQQKRF